MTITRSLPPFSRLTTLVVAALVWIVAGATELHAQGRFLGRAEIEVYGIGLKVEPPVQTVPKDFATIVSTFLQAPTLPGSTPAFAPDAVVRATLRGPSFPQPIELVAQPNAPFNIPVLTVPGLHTVENIRLVSGGQVLLYGTPEVARIEVIEKLLVTSVTTRALTADEIREKGIVYDKSNFQAYNFTAAFAIDDGSRINIEFPVLLPTLPSLADINPSTVDLQSVDAPQLQSLKTLIPDTLKIQARIPNLSVVGFTLTLDTPAGGQDFYAPPIPGVIVIPGDIGFLNQFFSVMLMVANVAPTGSNLVVSDLTASIVLPPGKDNVVGSLDDPLAMAKRAGGEFPRVVAVTQPGPDGKLGTGDDITTLGPGQTGNAEYLVEGRREGTHVVEMELLGTLNGLPVGPVPVRGRAAGAVLVRNPTFTLTFTHPEIVNAREPYTLDVTVTNTSESPANFVSVNLFPANISGAVLDDESGKNIEQIAPGDSETVTFRLISNRTGKVTAATLDSDENVQGRFVLKSAIGELGVPLSPDSFVLPGEASALDATLRQTAVDLMARAWAVATAPPAALPKDLSRFSKQVVLDRGVETAEAGLRVTLGESMPRAARGLLFDFLGTEYSQLPSRVPANDTSGLLELLRRDVRGFDLVRRKSMRGDLFADAVAKLLTPEVAAGAPIFHLSLAEQMTSRPGHVSVLVSASGGPLGVEARLVDSSGRRLGGLSDGKVLKDIPFGDVLSFRDGSGNITAQLLVIAVPSPDAYTFELTPRSGADQQQPYDLSVVLPGTDGKLRFASLSGLALNDGFNLTNGGSAADTLYAVKRDASGGTTATAAFAPVNDPPPTILGVRQVPNIDLIGCPLDPQRQYPAGRVVAVLFSEEVSPASVQDKADPGSITAFKPENNRAVGVALQPGGRIVYVALRSPIGPFEPRTMTVEGAQDLNGNTFPTQTLPIQIVAGHDAGVVYGQVLKADGAAAAFSSVRMFYEFSCPEGPIVEGIAEQTTDAQGRYQFDYVLRAPGMNVKLVAVDDDLDQIKTVRFGLARNSQRLNVNLVFIGRGSVTGRTLAEDGRTPLPGTVLRATSLTDQSQYGATADAQGRYGFTGVPVGNLLIEAVNTDRPASVFVSENIPFAGASVERDVILLDVATTAPIKRGTISGRVVRADGTTPVTGIPVIGYYKTRSQPNVPCPIPQGGTQEPSECALIVGNTNNQGRFELAGLAAGEIRVNTFDQVTLQEGNVRLTLTENQTADVTVLLGGGFGTVHGVVLDASHTPVADAVIGGGGSLVNAGPDGSFTLTDIPVGRTKLVAVSEGLRAEGQTFVDIVQNGEAVNATIVLEPVGSVTGVVRNHNGVPQAGIKVWVFQDCYDEFLQASICIKGEAITDPQGLYRIDKLAVAQYRISAFTSNLKDGNVFPIAIRYSRQLLIADITFRGSFGTVKGRVLRADNCQTPPCGETPLPAKVSLSGDRLVVAGGQIGVKFEYVQNFTVVDNNFTTGEYEFKDQVFTGPFTVRAAGQFSPEPVAAEGVMPGPGQTVTIDLRLQPTSRITGTVYGEDGFTPVTGKQISLTFKSNAVIVFCHDDSSTGDAECTTIPQGIQEAFAATDPDTGRFSFPVVNAGPFTITARDAVTGQVAEITGSVRAGDEVDLPVRMLGRQQVTVRVFRSNGVTPVVGATVDVQGLAYPRERRPGVTAADGSVVFGGGDALSEGEFVVTAMDQNGFAGRKSGRVVANGGPVVVDVFLFDATGTVTGQVVRADATSLLVPVPNAEVILSNASGPLAYAVTDAQGTFTVPLMPTGTFTAEGFDPVTAARGRNTGVVLGGAQPTAVTVTLESLGSIRGTVVESGSRAPLKGWTVQLRQTTFGGRSLPTQIAQTGVDGSFSFPGAPVGNFVLQASKRGIVGSASVSGQVSRGGQLIDVPMVVNIVRVVTGTVSGLVALPGGAPAPNAQVEVCATDGCHAVLGGNDGRFSLPNVPLGRFTVRASAQVTGNPSVGTTGGTLLFEGDVADTTVTLLGLSVIEGTVFETQNNQRVPAANATVRLYGQPGSGCPGACQQGTDAQGRFRFINVPAQTFTIVGSSLTGQQGSVGDVLTPGQTRSGLEVVLAPAVSLSGRVLFADGSPARSVVADLTLNGGHLFVETGADGTFTYEALGAGNYALFVQEPVGGGIARRNGAIALGGPLSLGDITLDEAPPAVISSTPANGDVGVSRTTDVRVRFSESLTASTVNTANVALIGPSGQVSGLVDTLENDTVIRFRLLPGAQLADQARYTIRVTGVTDRAGRTLPNPFVASFTTVDVTPPAILEMSPTTTATGVSVDTVIRVKFNEIIDPSKFTAAPISLSGPHGAVAGRTDYLFSDTVIVFTPNLPLAEDAAYTVTIAPATDLTGLTQAGATSYGFTTTDRTPPVVTSLTIAGTGSLIQNTVGHATALVSTTDISVVDFFINDTFAFADRIAPFVLDFQVNGAPGGQIKISAVATDTSGNRGPVRVDAFVTILEDRAPTIAFTAPASTLSPAPGERINVSVRATDDVGVREISYSARGAFVIDAATRPIAPASGDRSEDFAFNVPADAVPGSLLTIQASAKDTGDRATAAVPLELRIRDTVGPLVQITGVSSGQRVLPGARVTAVVTASDTSKISQIGFVVSGVTVASETRQISPAQTPVATSFEFVVPSNATSTDRVLLDAFAVDGAGNRSEAARLIVPVADQQAPTVTLRTSTGALTMVPGSTVDVVVEAADDLALSSLQLIGSGAFVYSNVYSLTAPSTGASFTFTLNVPITVSAGATELLTARATDASGNPSVPVSITLTAQIAHPVTLPPSLLLLAGEQTTMAVSLGSPAPAGGVRVDLGSHNAGVATVTPFLVFNEGETSKNATVTAVSGGSTQIDALIGGNLRATTTVTVSGGVVRGEVVDSTFAPVADAQVTIFHDGTPITTTSDAQGRFLVEGVSASNLNGRVFAVGASDGTRLGFTTDALDVERGSANVTVILLPVGAIKGTVFRADVATAVGAGVKVDLYEAGAPSVIFDTVFTDANGEYRFPLVAPGPYFVEASDASGNRGRSSAQVNATGEEVFVPVVYLGRGTVTVHVIDGGGVSVSGAQVELRGSSLFGSSPVRTTNANASGDATFNDVFVGSVTVTARDLFTTQAGTASGQLTADGETLALSVQFAPYANLTGTVFRRDGVTKAPGASVTIDCGSGCRFTTASDANGVYRFEFLPLRSFTLTAFDPGTRGRGIETGALTVTGQTVTRHITLLPQGALLITVNDADGNPVNGASVSASTSASGITDNLQGVTGIVNGTPGQLLLDRLLAGAFTVNASAAGLNGSATGTLFADEVRPVTVQLEARATLAGTVYEPDGQTPAAGFVRIYNQSGQIAQLALVNGAFSLADLRLGSYSINAYDTGSRRRATESGIVLSSNGQVQERTLTLVGLGTVQGQVIHPTGGDAGNLPVDLRSLHPEFGGFARVNTDAAGHYVFNNVVIGAVSVTTGKPAEQLLGEASGTLTQHGQTITLPILLQTNAVNLPVTLNDVQNSAYIIAANGGLFSGTGSVFSPEWQPAGTPTQGTVLTITAAGTPFTFGNAAFATQEDGGREIAVRREGLAGLNVTRKIFVPQTGFFARYLEILQNPTSAPITVDVRVDSAMYSGNNFQFCSAGYNCRYKHFVATTSSGDNVVSTTDRWVSLGAGGPGDPLVNSGTGTPLAFVFAGSNAPVPATVATFSSGGTTQSTNTPSTMRYGWGTVTIPANGTVALMHFVSEQAGHGGATASAQRLGELPPEALAGLSQAEIGSIANFVVAPDGASSVAPLPAINGVISGRVFEGDGVTPVPGATVTFTSGVGVFARQQRTTANSNGEFTLAGGIGGPIPLGSFTLTATHPSASFTTTPATAGTFAAGQAAVAQDVSFSDRGVLKGIVRRHNGAPVSGASVVMDGSRATTTTADGRYFFGGVFPGPRALSGSVQHAQGTSLSLLAETVNITAGQSVDEELLVQPTGTVTGTVREASGAVRAGAAVTLTRANFSRSFSPTGSNGRFTFTDVPLGSFVARSTDQENGFEVTQGVALTQADETQDVTLTYLGKGSISVTVTRSTGAAIAGMSVTVSAPGTNTQTKTTAIVNGVAVAGPFNDLPIGQTYTITAAHPNLSTVIRTVQTLILSGASASTTMALPAFGGGTAIVTQPNSATRAQNMPVSVISSAGTTWKSGNTTSSGTEANAGLFDLGPIPVGTPFSIRATRSGGGGVPTYSYTSPATALAADGETVTVTTHIPAVATLLVRVRDVNGNLVSGARVDTRDSNSGTSFSNRGNTNASGERTVANLPEGAIDVRVYTPPGNTAIMELASSAILPSQHGQTVTVEIGAKAFNVTLTGTITEADGTTRLPNVSLQILRAIDRASLASFFCSRGQNICGGISGPNDIGTFGSPSVTSTGAGLILRAQIAGKVVETPVVPTASGALNVGTIVMPVYSVTLTGHVYTADGVTPFNGGTVIPMPLNGDGGGFVYQVGADGRYQSNVTAYPTEGMRLRFEYPGLLDGAYHVDTAPFTQSGQTVTTDIVVPAGTMTTITGKVVAVDGATPIPNASVDLVLAGIDCSLFTATVPCVLNTTANSQGAFSFKALVPSAGEFLVRAHSPRTFSIVGEKTGSNLTQGGTVDLGNVTVPVTMLSGFVTDGPTKRTPSVTAYVRDSGGSIRFADQTPGNGQFGFYELPPGAYQLTVENTEAVTRATIPVTLAADSAFADVHIELPPVSRVEVRVLDANGQQTFDATVTLTRAGGDFERYVYSGSNYAFDSVAFGDYTVQASIENCDDECTYRFASAAVSVTSENAVQVTLSLRPAAQATVAIRNFDGSLLSDHEVTLAVQPLAGGPLGSFTNRMTAFTNGSGRVHLTNLPVGPFALLVTAVHTFVIENDPDDPDDDEEFEQRMAGTYLGAAAIATPLEFEVSLSFETVALDTNFFGEGLRTSQPFNRYWVFNRQPTIVDTGFIVNNQGVESSAFSRAVELQIQGREVCCPLGGNYSQSNAELTFTPAGIEAVPGIVATRRMRVIPDGSIARVLDTLVNTSAVPQTFTVSFRTQTNQSSNVVENVSPSTTSGGYVVVDDADTTNRRSSFAVVFAGVNPPSMPSLEFDMGASFAFSSSGFSTPTTITLAPGQQAAFLNFVVAGRPTQTATVAAQAQALATLTQPQMLLGLSRADILRIVNFRIPPPPPGPSLVSVKVKAPWGAFVTWARVAITGNGYTQVKNEFQTNGDVYELANVPAGDYSLQASLNACDYFGCTTMFTEQPLHVEADTDISALVSFEMGEMGRAKIIVADGNGPPMAGQAVEVEIRAAGGLGPLGGYVRDPFTTTLDGQGALTLDWLPSGAFSILVRGLDSDRYGVAEAIASKGNASVSDLRLSDDVSRMSGSAFGRSGPDNVHYVIDSWGTVAQLFLPGGGGAFEYAAQLHEAGSAETLCCPIAAVSADYEVTLTSVPLVQSPGVMLSRRLHWPEAGGFLRVFDVLTNTSTATRNVQIGHWTKPDLSATPFGADVTPSAATGGYFVREGAAEAFAVVYAGPNAPLAPVMVTDDVTIVKPTTTVALAPGERIGLLHFVVGRPQNGAADARSAAESLSTLTAPNALEGLTRPDLALIRNFQIELPPPGPSTVKVRVTRPDGTIGDGAHVALIADGFEQVKDTWDVNGEGLYEFTGVPAGGYLVQASFDDCSPDCTTLSTEARVDLAGDVTVVVPVSFATLGSARVYVRTSEGASMPGQHVDVRVRSLVAAGPLGTYQRELYDLQLDAQGSFLLDRLPPGAFVVQVYSPDEDQSGVVTASAIAGTQIAFNLRLAAEVHGTNLGSFTLSAAEFAYLIDDAGAVWWTFSTTTGNQSGSFGIAAEPHEVDDPRICCALAAVDVDGEVHLTPVPLVKTPGVLLTRRLRAPQGNTFLRVLDQLTNTSNAPRTLDPSNWVAPTGSPLFRDTLPSAVSGGYVLGQAGPGDEFRPASFGVVYAGVNPVIVPQRRFNDDQTVAQPTHPIQLAPGQTVSILHYVFLRHPDTPQADVIDAADALANLTAPAALEGLSPEDLTTIVNFRIQ